MDPQPPRSRPAPMLVDCIGTVRPVTSITIATEGISEFGSDDEVECLTPRTVGSDDLDDGRESRASGGRNWGPFPKIAKVALKTHLLRSRARDIPIIGAKRASKIVSPLNQTWYKERDGWRWVERDLSDVLAELRKLR